MRHYTFEVLQVGNVPCVIGFIYKKKLIFAMVFYINDGLVTKNLRIVCLDEAIQVTGMQSFCLAEHSTALYES